LQDHRRSWFELRVLAISAALTLMTACGGDATEDTGAPPTSSTSTTSLHADTTPITVASAAQEMSPASTAAVIEQPAEVGPSDLVIQGTGKVYSLEEAQAFGEFGPLLWNLVTTLNGSDTIEHGPGYEWVIWGPLWGGPIPYETNVYGITDLSAVDPDAAAAAVPAGTAIRLRQVPWSLDDLGQFKDRLLALAMDGTVCQVGPSSPVDGITVVSVTDEIDLVGVPPEVVRFEIVESCPPESYVFGEPIGPTGGSNPNP